MSISVKSESTSSCHATHPIVHHAGTKGRFIEALQELKNAVASLPSNADYRRAIEATIAYRMKVCDANASDAAIEEVLDAHLEELIKASSSAVLSVPLLESHMQFLMRITGMQGGGQAFAVDAE